MLIRRLPVLLIIVLLGPSCESKNETKYKAQNIPLNTNVLINTPAVERVKSVPIYNNVPDQPSPKLSTTAPSQPIPKVGSLVGLDATEVTKLLGPPEFQRLDEPAQLWQYRRNGCILYLFLYPSANGPVVQHFETRLKESTINNAQFCFASMMRLRRNSSS